MRGMICVWTVVFCLWALPGHAAVLDPWALTSLITLNVSETVDTDSLARTGSEAYPNPSIFVTRTVVARGQIDLRGTIDAGSRPLGVIAGENMTLSGETRLGNISLSSGRDLIMTTETGITGRTVSLGSGIVTLTGGTISGSANFGVTTVSSGSMIIGSPGVTLAAPVPVPAAFLLFATGLAAVGLMKRRKA